MSGSQAENRIRSRQSSVLYTLTPSRVSAVLLIKQSSFLIGSVLPCRPYRHAPAPGTSASRTGLDKGTGHITKRVHAHQAVDAPLARVPSIIPSVSKFRNENLAMKSGIVGGELFSKE